MMAAIFFDVDNTLYDYDARHAPAYRAISDYAGKEWGLSSERFDALHREASREMVSWTGGNCAAIHNRLIRYQLMLEFAGLPIRYAPKLAALYWDTFLSEIKPFPDAKSCLRQLREQGCKVGIGTNMTADYQFAKLERLNLLSLADFLVSSEEANAEKPDSRFFTYCARRAGCPPEDCVFVGDNLKGDVLGAQDAGMRAVWLSSAETVPGILQITSLGELPALIKKLERGGQASDET